MLRQGLLKAEAVKVADRIAGATEDVEFFRDPYQHLVVDDIFSDELAKSCLANFPDVNDPSWDIANHEGIEVKARTKWADEFDIPDGLVDAIRVLNSAPVLRAMSARFGIPKLMPDPYFTGGGLNFTPRSGLLDVHVDGNYHDASGMNRRMNALVYLNPDWQPSWGGEFGVYETDGETLVKSIAPLMNRLVLFDSHDKSYHGLPNPIQFPDDSPRRSIILYYYTVASRPADLVSVEAPHSALWRSKGFTDKHGQKTRTFD